MPGSVFKLGGGMTQPGHIGGRVEGVGVQFERDATFNLATVLANTVNAALILNPN